LLILDDILNAFWEFLVFEWVLPFWMWDRLLWVCPVLLLSVVVLGKFFFGLDII
jgi:hypothetical protein